VEAEGAKVLSRGHSRAKKDETRKGNIGRKENKITQISTLTLLLFGRGGMLQRHCLACTTAIKLADR
jgi:hypothetical protein